jgi:hypothetical protein
LNWYLRDFGYDVELLGRDEVDERQLVGLRRVVKISHIVFNGTSLLRLDGFAPASRWEELSPANLNSPELRLDWPVPDLPTALSPSLSR